MKTELSDGEWVLMNRLWQDAPKTITQLTAALKPETGWSKHTVISMLSRLEGKGAVSWRDSGRAKEYYPLLLRGDAARFAGEYAASSTDITPTRTPDTIPIMLNR